LRCDYHAPEVPHATRACSHICGQLPEGSYAEWNALHAATALREKPPPTLEVVRKRLGYSSSCVLRLHSPVLCDRLRACGELWRLNERQEIRKRLEGILNETPPRAVVLSRPRFRRNAETGCKPQRPPPSLGCSIQSSPGRFSTSDSRRPQH
jgi:hypothetical protein